METPKTRNGMSSMRQLTYVSPGKVEWREVPLATLQSDGDALVRPLAVTRCGLDLPIVTGKTGWAGPFALGHETAGEVVAIGDAVASFRPGDRVIVPFQVSCGQCAACRRGLTGNCESVPFRSSYGMAPLSGVDYGGRLSDLIRVPFADHMLLAQPPELDVAIAAGIADNVTDGFRSAVPYLQERPGARVLVVGGGLYAAQAAKVFGAAEVVYVDSDERRLAVARTLGLNVVERGTFEGRAPGSPFPITIDASWSSDGLGFAIRSTEHGGICHRTYGGTEPLTGVPLRDMYGIGLSLHLSRVHARARMPEVIEHVRSGRLHPGMVITRRAKFAEAAEAIFDPTVKVVFVNEDAPAHDCAADGGSCSCCPSGVRSAVPASSSRPFAS
jgi:threonine dehydrogenase-like Zn-dependent dehydrogenase